MTISIGEDVSEQAIVQTLEDAGFEVEYRKTQDRHHVKSHKND